MTKRSAIYGTDVSMKKGQVNLCQPVYRNYANYSASFPNRTLPQTDRLLQFQLTRQLAVLQSSRTIVQQVSLVMNIRLVTLNKWVTHTGSPIKWAINIQLVVSIGTDMYPICERR